MLHAHRQAWVWQDEWHGLTMKDIRLLEEAAARELMEKMAAAHLDEEDGGEFGSGGNNKTNQIRRLEFVDTTAGLDNRVNSGNGDETGDGDSGEYSDGMPSSLQHTDSAINAAAGKRRSSRRLSTDSRGEKVG